MKHPRLWVAAAVLTWLGAALYGGTASAHADGYCNTNYANSGRDTETYCYWADDAGYGHRSYTYCFGSTGHCTTRDVS